MERPFVCKIPLLARAQGDSAWLCPDKSAGIRASVERGWIEVGVRVKWLLK